MTTASSQRSKSALAELGLNPKDVAFVSGIGCSGKICGYLHSYAFHGVHGRALPVATAVKLANKELTVIAAGGDGDGYAIGAGPLHSRGAPQSEHHVHRDGQPDVRPHQGPVSPTSAAGYVTGTSPNGNPEAPINGLASRSPPAARSSRAASPRSPKLLVDMIKEADARTGLLDRRSDVAVRDLQQGQHVRVVQRERLLSSTKRYDPTDKVSAFKMLIDEGQDAVWRSSIARIARRSTSSRIKTQCPSSSSRSMAT